MKIMFSIDCGYYEEDIYNEKDFLKCLTKEEKEIYENEFTFDLLCDCIRHKEEEYGRDLTFPEILETIKK